MNEDQRRALSAIQFGSVLGTEGIWSPLRYHVDGLHPLATARIRRAVEAAASRPRSQPTGLILSGERGVGKTHMLGWLRAYVQEQGGSFFMPKLLDGASFWAGAVHGIVNQLRGADGGQLGRIIDALSQIAGCDRELRVRLHGTLTVGRDHLDEFIAQVDDFDSQSMRDYQDTLRALVLYQANQRDVRDVGLSFLLLEDGIDETDRAAWGFRSRRRTSQQIFNDLSWLFALTGPVVLAVDQIDSVIAQSGHGGENRLAQDLADGLMRMREETVRTIIVAACIPKSWELLADRAVNSAADRFTVLELSTNMPSTDMARTIVVRHLAAQYGEIGFEPPFPSWPVSPLAFEDRAVANYTPRRLLQQVDEHVQRCLNLGTITELEHFEAPEDRPVPLPTPPAPDEMAVFDAQFERLCRSADVVAPLDPRHEDERMFALLNAALRSFALEQRGSGKGLTVDQAATLQSALHARLRRTLDEATEDEEHWSFRSIGHTHARAVQTRLRSASLEAGIQPGTDKRHLVVVRNMPFSPGRVTSEMLSEFQAAGGVAVPISEEDLRVFAALDAMLLDSAAGFADWLVVRKPASRSQLLSRVIPAVPIDAAAVPIDPAAVPTDPAAGTRKSTFDGFAEPEPAPAHPIETDTATTKPGSTPPPHTEPGPAGTKPAVPLGRTMDGRNEFRVPLVLLRKHTAVFAGSGSGKTVLLRRLVEEAALQGVSAILIDSNNDLARLGDPWPEPPIGWGPRDADRAAEYLENTDVVVWTPRREAGRPLALNPLPDFRDVLDDPDELLTSIDASVAGLLPRAGLTSRETPKGAAVLREALTHFATQGGSELRDFVALLANLPEGVSIIANASRRAAEMADSLTAAMINDPVFGGAGERLDPGALLTPAAGKRARVSVVNFIGLPTDEQRQTFVNQLQLALFAWIKRNPARDRPLGSLFVLDEAQTFVPSLRSNASKESTLKLATQARKYGLGMVYATQAPKALDNMVTGNAATQFFGLLNASVQIQAATELARAKGGRIDDISHLKAGRFYGATEGSGFEKIDVPMCLSHHPSSALTEEEVIERARRRNE
ncbi:helicase HerA domain-containing protein [Nocardia sp. BMG111209]|uniref:helicase HerA domain-containing protein n=1 Tax=Nocardia sp. BMG111209 TaxID=1160137 RepID=UPI000371011C|nr:DUF87 domain-containing protein [Nocardia sp. BMG111209]